MRLSNFIVTLLLLIGFSSSLKSQSDTIIIPQDWLQKLAAHRDYHLTKDVDAIEELRLLFSHWDSLGASKYKQIDFTFNVLIARAVEGWSYKFIKKKAKEYSPGIISDTFTEDDLRVIENNADVLDLLLLGILKWEYPFVLDPDAEFLQELNTYNLTAGEKIADIGAGRGVLCIVLKILNPETEIYINELNRDFIEYVNAKLSRTDEAALQFGVEAVKGGRRSTELEGFELDKIIVRNTLHHFKAPEEMLESIKASLKIGGQLFVYESVPELDTDGDVCSVAISRDEVLELLSSSGFQLEAEWKFGEGVLLQLTYN